MIRKILTSSLIALVGIGGFFVNIEKQGAGSVTMTGINIVSATGSTADQSKAPNPDTSIKDLYNKLVAALNIALGVLTFIVSPAIMFAGWLMSPDWTTGELFGIRNVMHTLWVTVSNILYFVYAILLIVIALATMFNQEKFGYKVMLPKLALGIIMVPFTWWFVQWTVSLAAVVTASVVTIPQDAMKAQKSDWWEKTPSIPKSIEYNSNGGFTKKVDGKEVPTPIKVEKCEGSGNCLTPKEFLEKAGGQWAPLMVYAYSVFKFQEVDKIDGAFNTAQVVVDLINRGIIGAIMFLVFGILVMALIFMLLIRAIKLWFYAIFSPLFTLHFVVGKDLLGEKMDDFSLKEFIGLAFVPAVVGLTLSFGLVIISALSSPVANPQGGASSGGSQKLQLFGNPNSYIESKELPTDPKTSETEIKIGEVSYKYTGPATNGRVTSGVTSALNAGGNFFGTIIIDIIALIFIWAAFMAAKNVSKAVKAAVDPFEKMGQKIGELGMSLPKYAPILPASMGGSVAGAGKMVDMAASIPDAKMRENLDKNDTYKMLKKMAGQSASTQDIATTKQIIGDVKATPETITSNIRKYKHEDNKELLDALKSDISGTERAIRGVAGANEKEVKELFQKIKDGKGNTEDSLRFQAIMGGAGWMDVKDRKEEDLKTLINQRVQTSPPPGTPNSTGANKIDEAGIHLTFGNTNITLEKANRDSSAKEVANLILNDKGKLGENNLTTEQIKSALGEIFKKDGKTDDKKIDEILKELEGKGIYKKT